MTYSMINIKYNIIELASNSFININEFDVLETRLKQI